jgi:periodic tryptophan protein 1
VLSLSLNAYHKNILASGSADSTVKIWDLTNGVNIHTCSHHQSRVTNVSWSPTDKTVIATASDDRTIAMLDSRYPKDLISHRLPDKTDSVESVCWNINRPAELCYSTNSGILHTFDVRNPTKLLVSFTPHQGHTVTAVRIGNKNLCYTCSEDESVRVWAMGNLEAPLAFKKPKCVTLP